MVSASASAHGAQRPDSVVKTSVYVPPTSALAQDFLGNAGLGACDYNKHPSPMYVNFGRLRLEEGDETVLFSVWALTPKAFTIKARIADPYQKGARLGLYLFDMDDPRGLDDFETYSSSFRNADETLYKPLCLIGIRKDDASESQAAFDNAQNADGIFCQGRVSSWAQLTVDDVKEFQRMCWNFKA